MPYELSSWMLHQCTGMAVSTSTLWNWVERYGALSKSRLEAQLEQYLQGESMPTESLDEVTAALRLAIAADGVMVPFRPTPKTPKGKIQWREIKVGLLVRLGHKDYSCRQTGDSAVSSPTSRCAGRYRSLFVTTPSSDSNVPLVVA